MGTDITVTKYLVLGVCFVALVASGSCAHTKVEVRRAIEAGADPLEARCALAAEAGSLCYAVVGAQAAGG